MVLNNKSMIFFSNSNYYLAQYFYQIVIINIKNYILRKKLSIKFYSFIAKFQGKIRYLPIPFFNFNIFSIKKSKKRDFTTTGIVFLAKIEYSEKILSFKATFYLKKLIFVTISKTKNLSVWHLILI